MIEKNLLIMNLQNEMKAVCQMLGVKKNNLKVYIFGSSLKIANPNDLDILIIYEKDFILVGEVLVLRQQIYENLKSKLNIDIDICLLSDTEEKQCQFAKLEGAYEVSIA